MTLTKEQIKQLKEQLKAQVQSLPPEQRSAALSQIDSMSDEAIESMLKQQQEQQSSSPENPNQKNIFRMIVDKEIDSVIVSENSSALAVLDINPISKGHTMIIPKSPVSSPKEIPNEAFQLAEFLSKKMIENLNAKEAKAHTQVQFGEAIIHLIPIYPDSPNLSLSSPRSKATPESLSETAKNIQKEVIKISSAPTEKIVINTKPSKSKKDKKSKSKNQDKPLKLPRRIP
jgi:histidine triad (HIT) family protein